jgi:hypothetical protein
MIIMGMFINRKEELSRLLDIAKSKKSELVLIYGRRRVGKSRLLVEFAKRTGALYLLADVSKNILDILSRQIKDGFVRFDTWEDFFEFIYRSKYKLIIIDEFQYLYQINKAWPTQLQRWWEKIKETDKKIILCGSIISTIYKISKGYGSALYGRKTCEIRVDPIRFEFIGDFLKNYNIGDLIRSYSIVGGVPRYLEEFDPNLSVEENIRKGILNKTSFLYNEPLNLFFEEFRNPAPYVSILLAITQGYVKFSEIASFSRIQSTKLSKYLLTLERVEIIEKDIPVTEKKVRAKTTRYRVKDNFYRFWFRFLFRNKSMIEQGFEDGVFNQIAKELNSYVSLCFEELCRNLMANLNVFSFTKIGKWWHKDREIDIVALNEQKKQILFGECKWKEEVNAEKVLKWLKKKTRYVDWNSGNRKESYVVFAKSFKKRLREFEGKEVFCIDLKDFERMIKTRK